MGWEKYLGWQRVDYTDQLFQSVVRTRYAKRQFSLVLTLIFVNVVKWYLKILFSFLFHIHPVIDFCTSITFSVVLTFKDHWIRNIIERFRTEIYALSRYLINNYTPENFKTWKRNVVLLVSGYFIIHILIADITKWTLIEQILHFLISYFVIEGIESELFVRWYKKLKEVYDTRIKSNGNALQDKEFYIQEDYLNGFEGFTSEDASCESEDASTSSTRESEEEELIKSWMLLKDAVVVLEDSKDRSIVAFED